MNTFSTPVFVGWTLEDLRDYADDATRAAHADHNHRVSQQMQAIERRARDAADLPCFLRPQAE